MPIASVGVCGGKIDTAGNVKVGRLEQTSYFATKLFYARV
jgi:hypothetical protein